MGSGEAEEGAECSCRYSFGALWEGEAWCPHLARQVVQKAQLCSLKLIVSPARSPEAFGPQVLETSSGNLIPSQVFLGPKSASFWAHRALWSPVGNTLVPPVDPVFSPPLCPPACVCAEP